VTEATADAWIAAWEAKAAEDGLQRGAAYWDAGWDCLAEQRQHRVRPLGPFDSCKRWYWAFESAEGAMAPSTPMRAASRNGRLGAVDDPVGSWIHPSARLAQPPLVDLEPEDVGPRVMARDVEVELAFDGPAEVDLG
jgi:hypothetical protein